VQGPGTTAKYLQRTARSTARSGLDTTINYLSRAASIGLVTTIKYLRRATSAAAGIDLGTPIKSPLSSDDSPNLVAIDVDM
jgi:hypothetical protein